MPESTRQFLHRVVRREAIGEIAAPLGTALLLRFMMSQPDWEEPTLHIVWGAAGPSLLALGSFLMLSGQREAGVDPAYGKPFRKSSHGVLDVGPSA